MYEECNNFDVTLETLESWRKNINLVRKSLKTKTFFLGFDGYIDSLYSITKSRLSSKDWIRMESMKYFGDLVKSVSGSSANVERVLKRRISGGFAPNTCKAINALGAKVCLIAALGYPQTNEVFTDLTSKENIRAISISNPGETLGLEFDDGKIMLTDFENILNINWNLLLERVGFEKFCEIINSVDVLGFGHWALIPDLGEIWEHLYNDILPSIEKVKNKLIFVDLADIKKRSKKDILEMLDHLRQLDYFIPVILSLNDQEATDISKSLEGVKKIDPKRNNYNDYIKGGKLINEKIDLSYLVIHSPHFATISTRENHYWVTEGFTSKPKFTTGAGDHFNSGLVAGLTCGLNPSEAILMGNALTGFFVRTGKSPNLIELSKFIEKYVQYIMNDKPDL